MTLADIMAELEANSDPQTKKTFLNHGAPEPLFGVQVQHLKRLQKKLKKHHELSLQLYKTGNSDAQYLAGLIADEQKISADHLRSWADGASWYYLSEYAVPWVAAETPHGLGLALEWIDATAPNLQATGWAALSSIATITPDIQIDLTLFNNLLDRISAEIHSAPNRVKYTMNGFVISCGCSVLPLFEAAKITANTIGKVSVDMGGTACKVPLASQYISRCVVKGALGKKKKAARC